MKIEIEKTTTVEFSRIRVGDFFLAPNGHLCLKIAGFDDDDNTYDLNNEFFTTYENEFVTKIDSSKISIKVEG